jgi:hypothetical protein
MITQYIFRITSIRWMFCAAFLGTLALTGCVVQPVGAVAVVGPPVAVVGPPVVVVGPEVVAPMPFVVVGGGRGYYRH